MFRNILNARALPDARFEATDDKGGMCIAAVGIEGQTGENCRGQLELRTVDVRDAGIRRVGIAARQRDILLRTAPSFEIDRAVECDPVVQDSQFLAQLVAPDAIGPE
jgi:hypothetical protein